MKTHHEKLTPLAHAAQNRCFGCGDANQTGLHLHFMLAEDGTVVCEHAVGDSYEGPKGFVHGGIIATLLDETMSKAVRSHGIVAMTRHMSVDYLRPVPSTALIRLEGILVHSEGRKHRVEARLFSSDDTLLAEAKGLFVQVLPPREKQLPTSESNPHG